VAKSKPITVIKESNQEEETITASTKLINNDHIIVHEEKRLKGSELLMLAQPHVSVD
jgi:ribosomal protein L2